MTSTARVQALRLGTSNAYLVSTDPPGTMPPRYVLFDAGSLPGGRWALRALARRGAQPAQIVALVVSHVHFDHVAGLRGLRAATGAPVLVHRAEAPLLEAGEVAIPPGATPVGRLVSALGRRATWALRFAPCPVDAPVGNSGLALAPWGVDVRLLHTPGHSPGSLTLLTPDGAALVGDLGSNGLPFGLGPIYPGFVEDPAALLASWRLLLDRGARVVYPGHGRPFPAERLAARLARRA